MRRTHLHDESRITNVLDGLYNPSDRPVAEDAYSRIEPDLGSGFTSLDLRGGLLDNVPMGRALDTELHEPLDAHIERLRDAGTAAGDEEDDDVRVVLLHPAAEVLGLMYRPAINLPYRHLRRRKAELFLDIFEVRRDYGVDQEVHGAMIRLIGRSDGWEHAVAEGDRFVVTF